MSSQKAPAIIDDELDDELTMADPDPTTPSIMFVHAGYRRLGEVGHHVRRRTKGLARVVSIDTKRRGAQRCRRVNERTEAVQVDFGIPSRSDSA